MNEYMATKLSAVIAAQPEVHAAFAAAWPVQELVQEALAQVTWYRTSPCCIRALPKELSGDASVASGGGDE